MTYGEHILTSTCGVIHVVDKHVAVGAISRTIGGFREIRAVALIGPVVGRGVGYEVATTGGIAPNVT